MDTGVIYCDDAWARLAAFPPESVDLIYLDPPFFSNRKYEVIWGDEAEVRSFEDRWDGGINVYVQWMRERVLEMRRVLKPTGQIYLHCDQHASHYLKVMMDEVFGRSRFLNEIIWHYQTSSGAPRKWLHRNHDTILRYAATDVDLVTWHHPRQPWPETTLKKWQRDENGRIYRVQNKFGKRYYVDPAGKLDDDVWEITLSARTHERLGFPTQKPQALLEKIVASSSNPGDVVLDPFCGCGTAIAAAQTLGRRWIGIDISPTAVRVMEARMARLGVTAHVVGMPVTNDELRALKPFEFQNLVIAAMNGSHAPRKTGDMGIDGFSWFEHHPIQVKQSDHVGRNVVDNFETALDRVGSQTGYIVAFSFTRGAREEVARVLAQKGTDIRLTLVSDLMKRDQPMPIHAAVPVPPTRPAVPDVSRLVESIRTGLAKAADEEVASPEETRSPQRSRPKW